MKKLHSYAFYALVAPAMTLGASSVMAQQPAGQAADREHQTTQQDQHQRGTQSQRDQQGTTLRDQDATQRDHSAPQATPGTARDQTTRGIGESDSQSAADRRSGQDQYRMQTRGNIDAVPAKGMQASNLMGADVNTTGGENVGSVDDLIIDEDGHIVAIVVGVGGFLGMGQRDVAIGWDNVTRTGEADDFELRVSMTRDELRAAPEFKKQD